MPKVLVVGLDGATFDIIHPLVADGRLPNLAYLLKEGAWGTLRSTIPPVTPLAWTSIFTGKNGGKHGIYDFQALNRETYEFSSIRTDQHREKTIWQLLSEAGKRSIVMDVPFTYPPQPLDGLMLSGYGTPRTGDAIFTYPSNFAALLPQNLHEEIRVALPGQKFDRSQRFIDEWKDVMDGRRKLLNHLVAEEEWDFFMVVFSITDNMAHVFWTYLDPAHPNYGRPEAKNYRDAFLHGYELCDQLLGELMEKGGSDTTTLVISDHGFGSVRPRQYIYDRLLKGGYITLRDGGRALPLRGQIAKTAVDTYNRFPFLREWVKGLRPDNRNTLRKSLRRAGIMPTSASIDFSRSKIIPSNFGLRIWVNDTDRFPNGIVPPQKKGSIMEELSAYLLADRDKATSEPIVANIYWSNSLYNGPFTNKMPDLVIEYHNFYKSGTKASSNNPFVEGGHTPDGIFLAHGLSMKNGKIEDANLVDLAPTILYLLKQPIPPDMDGAILESIFSDKYLADNPPQFGDKNAQLDESPNIMREGYSVEEEKEINDQLRQLGYIE